MNAGQRRKMRRLIERIKEELLTAQSATRQPPWWRQLGISAAGRAIGSVVGATLLAFGAHYWFWAPAVTATVVPITPGQDGCSATIVMIHNTGAVKSVRFKLQVRNAIEDARLETGSATYAGSGDNAVSIVSGPLANTRLDADGECAIVSGGPPRNLIGAAMEIDSHVATVAVESMPHNTLLNLSLAAFKRPRQPFLRPLSVYYEGTFTYSVLGVTVTRDIALVYTKPIGK